MLLNKTINTSWSFGVAKDKISTLQNHLGDKYKIKAWNKRQLPSVLDLETENPCLIWVSSESFEALNEWQTTSFKHLSLVPKVLILNEGYSINDLEKAIDLGITDIIKPPFDKKKTNTIVNRAMEVTQIQNDMLCMSREVMIEREILERKNIILSFLVDFLSSTSQQFDIPSLFATSFEHLNILLPIKSIHAAIWQNNSSDDFLRSYLYISSPKNTSEFEEWRSYLASYIYSNISKKYSIDREESIDISRAIKTEKSCLPLESDIICLPLKSASLNIGTMFVCLKDNVTIGKDQAVALNSAINHLSVSIHNAYKLESAIIQANHDPLTGAYNRRYFEEIIIDEIERVTRYKVKLSAVMIDIDYFKKINDQFGHIVGDSILKQFASLIKNCIRNTDYCIRYGGEEFLLLLPHTPLSHAVAFAERLRLAIQENIFDNNGKDLKLTASFGVSCSSSKDFKNKEQLIYAADKALYNSKKEGRNRVSIASSSRGQETSLVFSSVEQKAVMT